MKRLDFPVIEFTACQSVVRWGFDRKSRYQCLEFRDLDVKGNAKMEVAMLKSNGT